MTLACRLCGAPLSETFIDLGAAPLSNSFLTADQLAAPETSYPLHVYVCSQCLLVQLPDSESPDVIFRDYAYLSSYSDSWLEHCERYAKRMIDELGLDGDTLVVELASNDGYLLQYFRAAGVPVLGIEPAANVAQVALERGVPTEAVFFGRQPAADLVGRGVHPRLVVANNVLAHVPDLHDFVAGIAELSGPGTLVTIEVPHLLRLIAERQFDTIYHEHWSYFTLAVIEQALGAHGLRVHDVDELTTHGGSLRVHASPAADDRLATARVAKVRADEAAAGLDHLDGYRTFADAAVQVKCDLLGFLVDARERGQRVVGYGAPAKANTLLNYCGVGPELLAFTADRNPLKQGRYLPGSRIPVRAPAAIDEARPDYVLILPWNLRDEITLQLAGIREWGGRFVLPIPTLEVVA